MRKRLVALAGGLILVATVGKIITIPAVAQTIRAAFVKNIDEKGRNPWSQPLVCTTFSSYCLVSLPAVPAGMRLVVENINVVVETTNSAIDVGFHSGQDNGVGQIFPATYVHNTVGGVYVFYLNANFTEFAETSVMGPKGLQVPSVLVTEGDGQVIGNIFKVSGRITGYMVNLNN